MSEQTEAIELSEEMEVVGPGTMLREARLAMGLSQQQVSQRLNFRCQLIEQIEAEDFSAEMPPTFTRGYLRNYAKLVNVSERDVLAAYDHLGLAADHASKMQSFSKLTRKETENRILMTLTYIILIGLVALTGVWWYQQESELSEPAVPVENSQPAEHALVDTQPLSFSEAMETSPTTNVQLTDDTDSASDVPAEPHTLEEPVAPTIAEPESEPKVEQATGPADGTVPVLSDEIFVALEDNESEIIAVEPVPVSFYFRGDCWVNIFDATGERIAWGVKKADYTMNINGVPPFNVTLGKPDLVSVSYDGVPVDISQFGAGQIAKFELPLEEF